MAAVRYNAFQRLVERNAIGVPPSIPGGSSFTIDEPATTAGSTSIPAQQVQAVVYSDSEYLVVLHTDSTSGAGSHPIADGTAVALALQQYQDLTASVTQPGHVTTNPTTPKTSKGSGSTTRTVGFVLLGVVVLILAGFALFTWRRRRSTTQGGGETELPSPSAPEPERHLATDPSGDAAERAPVERKATRREAQSVRQQDNTPPNPTRGGELRLAGAPASPRHLLDRPPTATGWSASPSRNSPR